MNDLKQYESQLPFEEIDDLMPVLTELLGLPFNEEEYLENTRYGFNVKRNVYLIRKSNDPNIFILVRSVPHSELGYIAVRCKGAVHEKVRKLLIQAWNEGVVDFYNENPMDPMNAGDLINTLTYDHSFLRKLVKEFNLDIELFTKN